MVLVIQSKAYWGAADTSDSIL